MATTSTSTAAAAVEPVFTEPERLALAGFLAGYTGLTREAYALDLRQYANWCQQQHLRLFQARRAGQADEPQVTERDFEAAPEPPIGTPIEVICAPLRVCSASAWNRLNDLVALDARWRGPGRSLFGAVQGLAAGPCGAVQPFRRYPGRPGLILLSVQAGRLRTHRSVLLTRSGRWGLLAYPAGWSRWVSAVWRRPAPGVRTAWARARRDPARMMSFLARVTPV